MGKTTQTGFFQKLTRLIFTRKADLLIEVERQRNIIHEYEQLLAMERYSTKQSDGITSVVLAHILMSHFTQPEKMEEHLAHILSTLPLDTRNETLQYLDRLQGATEAAMKVRKLTLVQDAEDPQ